MKDWLSRQLLGVHLLAIAAITVCVLMGLWQLGVYGAKHDDKVAEKSNAKPVDLLTVWGPDDPFTADLLDRRVRIQIRPGLGISGNAFFTVERPDGQSWEAVTVPVRGTKSAIVLVLGHVPNPSLIDWGMPHSITAILQPSEASGALSMAERVNQSKQDLFSGYALADDPLVARTFKPVKPPEPHISWTVGLRNLAYAMQWWVFGLFAGFMWWRMATDAVAARRTPPDEVDGASGRP